MKNIFLISFSLICVNLCAQELNIGPHLGYKYIRNSQEIYENEKNTITFGGILEFRPKHAIFSLNTEVRCLFEKETIVQFPIYLKFIIGRKVRICPSLGAYFSSNGNYGVQLGLNFEVPLSEKICIYSRYEIYLEAYDESFPSHYANESTSKALRKAHWIGVGIKYNML